MRLDLRERTQACESSVVPDFNREHAVPRQRDYKVEYQRRIANAAKRGLSRSQARGHARAGEAAIRAASVKSDARLETALIALRAIGNQTRAAKAAGVSAERFRRFLQSNALASRQGRQWKFNDQRTRRMTVISDGDARQRTLRDFDQASLNGKYLNAVAAFLDSNDAVHLHPFAGLSVIDDKGRAHPFETDPRVLYPLAHAGADAFHEIYRLNA